MGGFVDPFVPEPAWPQETSTMFIGSSWPGSASSLANPAATYLGGAGPAAPALQDSEFHLQNGSSSTGALFNGSAKEMVQHQFLTAPHLPDDVAQGLNFEVGSVLTTPPGAISLTDSAPVVCSSNDSSGGSEQSGLPPRFLLGSEQQPAWPPSTFPQISSLVGEETSQSLGFGGGAVSNDDLLRDGNKYPQQGNVSSAPLQLTDDIEFDTFFRERVVTARVSLRRKGQNVEFNTGEMLSFTHGLGQQVNTSANFGDLQLSQKEFSGLRHLNLSGQQLSSFNATGATHNPEQSSEVSSGKIGMNVPQFMTRPEVANGNGAAGNGGAPKPRVRARRGQATDPHSIAERLRREKISDRMKNLQELVPNSNRTDKASMLEEIIEYVKFLQLQVKVLSMSRLGATEAVVPLLTESHTESSGGLLLSPRSGSGSGRQRAGRGSVSSSSSEVRDGAAFEQEVAQLMESNMTAAMQYLQSKGLCLMPIALASAISDQKGTFSAAVQPENGGDAKEMLRTVKPLGSPIQGR